MLRMRFHGRGGQGMKTASRIVGSAAFHAGFVVQDAPVYGAERRGAPMAAFTRIARQEILERGAITQPNLVVVADDTLYVLVMSNAFATKGKAAVQRLRARGLRAGLLRLRVLRPFPAQAIAAALEGRKAVAVIDQNLAPGLGGITYQEIAAALYASAQRPPLLSVIGGLGGKDMSEAEFEAVYGDLQRLASGAQVRHPRLLYTQPEQERMQTLLHIAGKEVVR